MQAGRIAAFEPISKFPAIRRDLAVVVEEETPAQRIRELVAEAAGPLLRELAVFDLYRGEGIESGRKSVALGLILQDSSRTLTDEDIDGVVADVTALLHKELGASLRE